MSVTGLGTKRRRSRFPILLILSGLLVVAAVGVFILELVRFTQQAEQLSSDVTVAGVEVGGLDPLAALAEWERAYAEPVLLYYADSPILLDPSTVGFRLNSDTMLADSRSAIETEANFWLRFANYMTGTQTARTFNVPLDADYQTSLLREYLGDLSRRYDRPPGQADFDVQTLTFRPGAAGFQLDIDAAAPLIDAALRDPVERTVVLPVSNADADRPNIEVLRNLIIAYLDSEGFIYDGQSTVASVFILDLQTGEEVNILGDVAMSAASTIKLPILISYFRNRLFAPTQEEAWLMANSLLCSNNSSSNLLMQIVGEETTGIDNNLFAGIEYVTNTMQYLGARNTYLSAPLVTGDAGQEFGSIPAPETDPNPNFNTGADFFNQTTTEDLGTLFALLYDCAEYGSGLIAAYPEGEFTQQECRQMVELMTANDLLRLLQGGVPAETRISHKNGWLNNVHGDAGVVYSPSGRNYVIAVFVWEDVEFFSFDRAWPLIEGISRATWNYFNPDDPLLSARTDLPGTAQECEGNYLPPGPDAVNLNDIDAWRSQ